MRKSQDILLTTMRLVCLVALSIVFATACDNNLPDPVEDTSTPIQFSKVQVLTKADALTRSQSVGVLAFYLESDGNNSAIWNNNATPNFMYNQLMTTLENGQLTYSPIKYWPSNTSDRIKFFAYSPHSSEANGAITLSAATAQGYPTLSYTPSKDISKQIDLLIAVTAPLNSGPVSLSFKHALTQLSFSAQCVNNLLNQAITITSIKLSNVANGNGQFTETGFEWTASTTTQDYTLSINQSITRDTSTGLSGSLYLVPQTSTCKLDIELMVGGIRKRTPQRDISTSDWAQGKKINYLLTINLSDLIAL